MAKIAPNPAKALLRNEIATRIAALTAEDKKRQSQIVYEKVFAFFNIKPDEICTTCDGKITQL